MSVPKLTKSEIEKYTGVSSLDEAELLRNIIGLTTALQSLGHPTRCRRTARLAPN